MLLIFLAEFKDDENIRKLEEQANSVIPKTFCKLNFVEGNIFCIVIQRAAMVNVEDFENNKSLSRFEFPFRDVIKSNN